MKKYKFLICFFLIISSGVYGNQYDCGKSSHGKKTQRIINLLDREDASYYYILTGDQISFGNHYAILMKSQDIVDYLESRVAELKIEADKLLLQRIKNDLPLQGNVDLFKYGLTDTKLFSRSEYIVDGLLNNGKISIVDLWSSKSSGTPLNKIIAVDIENQGLTKEYCLPGDRSIFKIVHSIDN